MICDFDTQTVWPSTLMYTNGLACNFYAQTVWPPTKPVTQLGEVGCKQNRLREKNEDHHGRTIRPVNWHDYSKYE